MKNKVIKITYDPKDNLVADGRGPRYVGDPDMDMISPEVFEAARPKLIDGDDIKGKVIIYGTSGKMKNQDEFKKLWNEKLKRIKS